jgi:hypothetical protein
MNKNYHPYCGRSHTKKQPNSSKPRISIARRRAHKARKQLLKLYPHLATHLHKDVTPASIYQHALTLAQASAPPGLPPNIKS